MSRIFISHSSGDDFEAIALQAWLASEGWEDVFLDLDPDRGIVAGQRWERRLHEAASRCEAVVFLLSANWLGSGWCMKEYTTARRLNKKLFAVLVDPNKALKDLPPELTDTWQVVNLAGGQDMQLFRALRPGSHEEKHVGFSRDGLTRLKRGLQKAGLDPRFFAWPPESEPTRAPYHGLKPLEAADAGIFFGRDAPIVEATDRLRGLVIGAPPRLMVILGASGAGKSSFLRAGLLPRLTRDDTHFVTLPPIRPGRAALSGENGLLRALEAACPTRTRAELRTALQAGATGLRPILGELAQTTFTETLAEVGSTTPPAIVLAIDQAEELFRAEGSEEGHALLALLRDLTASDDPVAVIAIFAIRSDSYDELEHAKELEGLRQDTMPLLPMPRGAYKEVIEGPARRVAESGGKLTIEPQLTERLLADIEKGAGSDALPLLAFALEQLYLEYHRAGILRLSDYDATGGLGGAIDAAVERAFIRADADPRIPRDRIARETLLRRGLIPWLAGIDPDTKSPRRNIAHLADIPEEAAPLINLLVEERLLSTDTARTKSPTGEEIRVATIEPTHEALLRQWGLLDGWLLQDFGLLATLEGVKRAARDWEANGRNEAWLAHQHGRLAEAQALDARPDIAVKLDVIDRSYVAACQSREKAAREEKEATLQREKDRLAEVAAAQSRTARMQKTAQRRLVILGAVLIAGLSLILWQQLRVNAQRGVIESGRSNLFAELSRAERIRENWDSALRLGVEGARLGLKLKDQVSSELGRDELWTVTAQSSWQLNLTKHGGWVSCAVFDPHGDHVLTASLDNMARVWDASSGAEILTLTGHEGGVRSARYNSDGSKIVTASSDKTARIWDAASGRQIGRLSGHTAGVMNAAFSPDDSKIVTASFDKTAQVWDVASGTSLLTLTDHTDWVFSASYSPDGTKIVTASQDKTARIFDAATGKVLFVLIGHEAPLYHAAFSPDGKRVVTASGDDTARVWDARTGEMQLVLRGHTDYLNSAVFSPDGKLILTASGDKTARLWDSTTGSQISIFRGHEDYLNYASFAADGRRIVTAAKDKTARVWNLSHPAEVAEFHGHSKEVFSAAFDHSGGQLITASADKTARIWDTTSTATLVILGGHDAALRAAAFDPDGEHAVTGSQDRTARIWDLATKKLLLTLTGHDNWVLAVAYSPDGSKIVTASWDTSVRVWDAKTGHALLELKGHTGPVWGVSFSPDGTRAVSASWDKSVRVWDVASGKQLLLIQTKQVRLWSAEFSPDGTRVLVGADDSTGRIWDAATGAELIVLHGHEGPVVSASYSPDGNRLVTGSTDGSARIWDARSGVQIAMLLGHTDAVNSAKYSPDGTRIVTASKDTTARLWDARQSPTTTEHLIDVACSLKLGSLSVLDRDEMRLAGYTDDTPAIDVCAQLN